MPRGNTRVTYTKYSRLEPDSPGTKERIKIKPRRSGGLRTSLAVVVATAREPPVLDSRQCHLRSIVSHSATLASRRTPRYTLPRLACYLQHPIRILPVRIPKLFHPFTATTSCPPRGSPSMFNPSALCVRPPCRCDRYSVPGPSSIRWQTMLAGRTAQLRGKIRRTRDTGCGARSPRETVGSTLCV